MVVFDIADRRIRLRQATGDQFEFEVVRGARRADLRLCAPPAWAAGGRPANAEFRVYMAQAAAKGIAQEAGLMG